jgi:hypothetical protein
MMHRYWITFESGLRPSVLNLGAGVTATSEADARKMVADAFDKPIVRAVEIFDMSLIDQRHVVPNMGNHFERGIWFPLKAN